jgi:hypothetical protein
MQTGIPQVWERFGGYAGTLVTFAEAASILDYDVRYFVGLVGRGLAGRLDIGERLLACYVGDGGLRCALDEVLAYKRSRDEARRAGLNRLTQESEALGLYDLYNPPCGGGQ